MASGSQHHVIQPYSLVRLCRRRQEFFSIINEALLTSPPWPSDLVDRVVEYVLEGGNTDLSVYSVASIDPFDYGHALGVIAEGISQNNFRATARKRKTGSTRGTLLIPVASLPESVRIRFTPENNQNFFPADDRHYDLHAADVQELARSLLGGIHERAIRWTFLDNSKEGSYRIQAVIAYSYCLSEFGKLDEADPPAEWNNGKSLSSSEQIEILKHLANTHAVDSPVVRS